MEKYNSYLFYAIHLWKKSSNISNIKVIFSKLSKQEWKKILDVISMISLKLTFEFISKTINDLFSKNIEL